MTVQAGEVWLAEIHFTDGSASKIRPVVADWAAAGLRVSSTVRLARLDCLEQPLLFRRLGVLSTADAQSLKNAWELFVKPQF